MYVLVYVHKKILEEIENYNITVLIKRSLNIDYKELQRAIDMTE